MDLWNFYGEYWGFEDGVIVLYYVVVMGLIDVVWYFVDNKIQINVDVKDNKMLIFLYYVYVNGWFDFMLLFFLEFGVNINVEIKMYILYIIIMFLGEVC